MAATESGETSCANQNSHRSIVLLVNSEYVSPYTEATQTRLT